MSTFIHVNFSKYSGGFHQGPVAHLMVLNHFVEKTSMDKLKQGGAYRKLSLAFVGFISLLAERDYSPGELAGRLGISRQACSKTIRELEILELIERRKHPTDSRSSVLSLSENGLQLLSDGIEVTNEINRQFATEVGDDSLQQLIRILERLCRSLAIELTRVRAPQPGTRAAGEQPTSFGLLLAGIVSYMQQSLSASLSDKGFTGLNQSAGPVLGLLDREERRIQYIASVIGVTKQAIALTASDLERAGYITKEPDPSDKRQIILQLTPLGKRLLTESIASVKSLETSFQAILGDDDYRLMDNTLAALYGQVAEHYDSANELPARIRQISENLIAELGVAGVRSLTQHLMTITRS